MEMLKQNDTDTYWCGIEKFGTDRGTRVKVIVYSGKYFPMGTTRQTDRKKGRKQGREGE